MPFGIPFRFFVLLCSLLLAACAGRGGPSGQPAVSAEPFQLKKAWENYVTEVHAFPVRISGSNNGADVSGSATIMRGELTPVMFEGFGALRKVTTFAGRLTANGHAVPIAMSTSDFYDYGYHPLGSSYCLEYVVVKMSAIPVTAYVNEKAALYAADVYTDSSKRFLTGTETVAFALEPDSASTAILRLITVRKDVSGNVIMMATETYRMTRDGVLTPLSDRSVEPNGNVLTATY